MSLPTSVDYQSAIQNPHQCFSDFELKFGTPVVDRKGFPKVATGNFAAVFPINGNDHKYAVKCFIKQQPDQEERYAAISSYLQSIKLPYVIDFHFLKQGILVNGKWLPVLKMEWVEGDTLGSYVGKNIDNPQALRNLARNFLEIAGDLRRHNIAHGDLQHGNVMVVENSLRLVDYDGMFVPGLEKKVATETGHPNYQHPGRGKHFGPFLDTFSVWVIYLSLVALSADTTLWSKLKLDEECLVFRKNDFSSPEKSEALQSLERSPDQNVRELAMAFRSLIYAQELTKLPSLVGNSFVNISPLISHSKGPEWMIDHISPVTATIDKKAVVEETGASWVLDHLQPEAPITLKSSFALERLVISLYAVSLVLILLTGGAILRFSQIAELWLLPSVILGAGFLLTCGFSAVVFFLVDRYRRLPEVKEKTNLIKKFKNLKKKVNHLAGKKNLEQLNNERNQLDKQEEKIVSAILSKQQESIRKEKTEIGQIEADLQTMSKRSIARLAEIQASERSDLAKTLQDSQNEYLKRNLEQHSISSGNIPGIGPKLTERLLFAGIHTAADVRSYINVSGVGPQKSSALLTWRQNLERDLRTRIPQRLPIHQEESIKAKYRAQIFEQKKEETKAQQVAHEAKRVIRERLGQEYSSLLKSIQDTNNQYASRRHELDEKITEIKQLLSEKQWSLSKTRKTLDAYRHIEFKAYLGRVLFG